MSETKKAAIKGVTVLVHWPDGDVLATASDFERAECGGFSLCDAQRMRAKNKAIREAIRKLCNENIVECMETYDCGELFNNMVRKKGFSMTVIPIGHKFEEIERTKKDRP